jgi:hypothetical protein
LQLSIYREKYRAVKQVYSEMVIKKNFTLIDSFFAPNIFDHGAFAWSATEQGGVLKSSH